jgi:hypothetical protein
LFLYGGCSVTRAWTLEDEIGMRTGVQIEYAQRKVDSLEEECVALRAGL